MTDDNKLAGLETDPGRPKQHAEMLIHPERTNLDEFLQVMGNFINRARRGEGQPAVTITLTGHMLPETQLEQYWNGDTVRLEVRVEAWEIHELESDGEVRARTHATGIDEAGPDAESTTHAGA